MLLLTNQYLEGDLWGFPLTRLASSRMPRKEKARIWLDSVFAAGAERVLARLVAQKAPGYEDFRNLSPDCFHSINHPREWTSSRSEFRTTPEPFLRGEVATPLSTGAFLLTVRDRRGYCQYFPLREVFLYACAHCQSAKRFAFIMKNLQPKLGKADFVDALGYSPLFYAAFTRARGGAETFSRWLIEGEGGAICKLIRKAGARPDQLCRHGFSWKDLVAVARETAAASGGAGTNRCGNAGKKPFAPKAPAPSPSLDEIRRMLIDDPDRAIAAIVAMGYEPRPLEKPFGPRERLLSDAICDRSIPRATRARLLLLCDHNETFACLPPRAAKGDIPAGFLDSISGRQWTCENKRKGCAFVRCSNHTLFMNVLPLDDLRLPSAGMSKLDQVVRRAIDADSPSRLAMALSILGRRVDTRLVVILLEFRPVKILEWLLENDEKTKTLLNPRLMLFYVCANWPERSAVDWLEKAEAKEPGVLKSCVDPLGRNLLWYTLYNWRSSCDSYGMAGKGEMAIVETLLGNGCDPDAETVWGLSWRDIREAGETRQKTVARKG